MSKRSLSQIELVDDTSSYEESSDYTYGAADAQYYSSQENVVDAYDLTWHNMNDEERIADINTYLGLQGQFPSEFIRPRQNRDWDNFM